MQQENSYNYNMINNLRLELSFKDIFQLEKKLNFCISNKIKKINIPCKGFLKKEFLSETIQYIGENYKDLDVIYHYSLYHQYSKNAQNSYLEFLNFIQKCVFYENNQILLLSGSNKKKYFEVLDVIKNLQNENNLKVNFGIAYNPYLEKYYGICREKVRLEKKISSGLIRSIWLQFGTDLKLLESEIIFLKSYINNLPKSYDYKIKIYGSLLIPSKQFISRFKFRPWKEVYISDKHLNSLDNFDEFTKDLIRIYLKNNICPVIETESSSFEKMEKIYNLFNNSIHNPYGE